MAWVEKDHCDHLVPTSCYVQGHQPADQAAQSHIQPGLECLQGWGIHSLLGQPVQCITTLWVKNFLLISNLNLPLCQLKTIPPYPITTHPHMQLFPLLFIRSVQVLEGHNEVSPEPSLLQAKQAQFPLPFPIGEVLQQFSGPKISWKKTLPRVDDSNWIVSIPLFFQYNEDYVLVVLI